MPWASPSFEACTSWKFLGVTHVASPSLSFSPSFISLLIPSIHLKFFLHTKHHTISISNISAHQDNKSFGSVLTSIKLPIKTQDIVALTLKISVPQKGINKKQMQIMAEIYQDRPAGKNQFFRRHSVDQIEKC